MNNTKETPIVTVDYYEHKLGGNTNALCDIAEFRFLKAMALYQKEKTGLVGVKLIDPKTRSLIATGFKRTIYHNHSLFLLTGQLQNSVAIPAKGLKPKLRIRTPFPDNKNFAEYATREIDYGLDKHQALEWAFAHYAINYDYEKLFYVLVPLVYADIFGEQLESGIYVGNTYC